MSTSVPTSRWSPPSSAIPGSASPSTTRVPSSTGWPPSDRRSSSACEALVGAGRVELLGGGYYEPVLASLPEADRLAQLRLMGDAIERIGGRRPTGAWLAERVWEPDLPVALVDGGYRWTILDDAHFRAASIDESDLWGSYTTDDQGRLLTVFGSDKNLRYRIPFGAVEDVIAYLAEHASPDRHLLGGHGRRRREVRRVAGHVRALLGRGRLGRPLLRGPRRERRLDRPRDARRVDRARSRRSAASTCPTSSYVEMGEWALPADEGLAFEQAVAAAQAEGRPEARWLRGGFWRNFQVKYREINDLHKQMLRTLRPRSPGWRAGPGHDAALRELMQGQSNDCYWHGVFGGIYIAHMRLATYEHLIAAEDCRRCRRPGRRRSRRRDRPASTRTSTASTRSSSPRLARRS